MTAATSIPALDRFDGRSTLARSPIPDIVEALKRVAPLHGMEQGELEWLAVNGVERREPAGTVLFEEGHAATKMTIILKGEIHVRRERGKPTGIFSARAGQITGVLPFSRMKTYGGQGYVVTDTWALEYDKAIFPEMLRDVPSMGQRCVSVLLDRVREITRLEQQAEKLTALGKLAGNLAHEMNNPASAAQRAAAGLLDELRVYGQEKFKLGGLCLDEKHLREIRAWQEGIREHAETVAADVAQQSLMEDALQTWLRIHEVREPWKIAPELAELGVRAEQLEPLGESLNAESLSIVLAQFASSVRAERIAEAMLDSTARIFDLIRAIKDYSYMDQAPIQEIDVRQGIENTLTMLQSRLSNVEIERRYAEVPLISAYGSELNQVWTALLENALDAINDHGRITIGVQVSGDMLLIEVWDDGPGIPPELEDRIFEPFFTTKAPGLGLGLGLDTAQRVIRRHRGYITVQSEPGATCFQVRLPIDQLQAY